MQKRIDVDYNDLRLSDIIQEVDRVFEGDQLDNYLREIKGLQVVIRKAYGLLGFIKFSMGYYIVMITDKKKVAKIGLHYIYKVKDMVIKPLFTMSSGNSEAREQEATYVQAFKDIQISKGFYFSYTYDITHSLQYNVLRQVNLQNEKMAKNAGGSPHRDMSNFTRVVSERIHGIIEDRESGGFTFSEEAKTDNARQ